MMRFYVASLVIGVMTWGATPPATLTVDVGTEFAVRYEINPEIVQITVDGEPVGSQVPPGPYVWEYKYDKGLIQFTRSDASVTTTYREIEGSPWAVLKCESAERWVMCTFGRYAPRPVRSSCRSRTLPLVVPP